MDGGGWLSTTGATAAGASAVSSVPVSTRSKVSVKEPSGNAYSDAEGYNSGVFFYSVTGNNNYSSKIIHFTLMPIFDMGILESKLKILTLQFYRMFCRMILCDSKSQKMTFQIHLYVLVMFCLRKINTSLIFHLILCLVLRLELTLPDIPTHVELHVLQAA